MRICVDKFTLLREKILQHIISLNIDLDIRCYRQPPWISSAGYKWFVPMVPMITHAGNQCQMVGSNPLIDFKFTMGPSSMFMGINLMGIFCILVLYTVGLCFIGYKCGYRVTRQKILMEKKTMTPVTYTSVRKIKHPQFEFSPIIDGCWQYPGRIIVYSYRCERGLGKDPVAICGSRYFLDAHRLATIVLCHRYL